MLKAVRSKTAVVWGAKEFFVKGKRGAAAWGEDGSVERENQGVRRNCPSSVESGERRYQLQTSGAVPTKLLLLESKHVRAL